MVSHPDEEDPGAICALLAAMKLNVWGGKEDYSVSLEQEEEKSGGKGRAKRARKRRVRISWCIFVFPFFFFFYCFVLLAAGMEGGEEGERRGVTVTVFCLIGYWCCCAAGPPSLPWWDLVGVWPTWWLCEEGMTSCRNVGSWRGVSFARRLINCSVPSVITFISIIIIHSCSMMMTMIFENYIL